MDFPQRRDAVTGLALLWQGFSAFSPGNAGQDPAKDASGTDQRMPRSPSGASLPGHPGVTGDALATGRRRKDFPQRMPCLPFPTSRHWGLHDEPVMTTGHPPQRGRATDIGHKKRSPEIPGFLSYSGSKGGI